MVHKERVRGWLQIDWYNFCREVCEVILVEESTPIGGPGKVVEVEESKFGYNRVRRVEGVWVLGGIDSRTRECFLVPVKDRSADTLIPIIKKCQTRDKDHN